jgi:CHAD domain-containing protein
MEESESLSAGLTGMMEQLFSFALQLCGTYEEDPEEAVHEIRRTFKKCRATLRMIRDPMGYAMYYRENRTLRDLQRLLSSARDTSVFCSLLDGLQERYPAHAVGSWWDKARKEALAQKELAFLNIRKEGLIEQISLETQQAKERIGFYQLNGNDFGLVRGGVRRIYRQGRKISEHSYHADADPVLVHQFRKKAKYLQYQLNYLLPIFPRLMKATVKTLEKLTDTLGDYHDLHNVLIKLPAVAPRDRNSGKKLESLFDELEKEMAELLEKAGRSTRGLYAENPDQFIERIHSYWNIYADQSLQT